MPHTRKVGGSKENNIYLSKHLSTDPNTDPNYHEIGIVHRTEIKGINLFRDMVTDISNTVGLSGVDSSVYVHLRNKMLRELEGLVERDQKIANIRFDFGHGVGNVILHAYGTLFKKKYKI
jgi:hypothetical protein